MLFIYLYIYFPIPGIDKLFVIQIHFYIFQYWEMFNNKWSRLLKVIKGYQRLLKVIKGY